MQKKKHAGLEIENNRDQDFLLLPAGLQTITINGFFTGDVACVIL